MDLDRTDIEILALLQNNSRLMNKQLAASVGLAPSSCHERVKRLWQTGAITGTQTLVDPGKLGFHLSALVFVSISKRGQIAIDRVLSDLIAVPEIQFVHLITGRYDLVVSMIARDMDHLKKIAYASLTDREEIASYETSLVYEMRRDLTVPTTLER